jgi:hypothetical protein
MSNQMESKIKFLTLVALLLLSLCGCYQDPVRAKLIGTWGIEHGARLTARVNQNPEKPGESTDLGERMVLVFYASGSLRTNTRMGELNREKNGSWNVVKFDEEKSKMKIRCELMGQQTEHEVRFIEEDLIRLVPPNMAGTKSKLTFRRK